MCVYDMYVYTLITLITLTTLTTLPYTRSERDQFAIIQLDYTARNSEIHTRLVNEKTFLTTQVEELTASLSEALELKTASELKMYQMKRDHSEALLENKTLNKMRKSYDQVITLSF